MVVWTVGPQNPELRHKITALQKEFARRGFTEAATLLNGFLRKSFSRPGVKDTMAAGELTTAEAIAKMMEAWKKIEAQAKKQFPNASKEELYRITKSAFESALKFKFSRPGVKDTMAVEDRFYFGKGRKERFA
jgi:hypothetical protein